MNSQGSDKDHIARAKFSNEAHIPLFPSSCQRARFGIGAGFDAKCSIRLSLPRPYSHGFGKVAKRNREPQPKA